MASKTGMFLDPKERDCLIEALKRKGEWPPTTVSSSLSKSMNNNNNTNNTTEAEVSFGTGCLTCGEDNDHANLLLCEACNDEYHTYCLDPPLRSVPTGDWFCGTFPKE